MTHPYINNARFSTTLNKTCLRELKKLRTLEGQVESMTVKNVQLYNSNREKDKEIDDLRNQNFKEWFKIANFRVKMGSLGLFGSKLGRMC